MAWQCPWLMWLILHHLPLANTHLMWTWKLITKVSDSSHSYWLFSYIRVLHDVCLAVLYRKQQNQPSLTVLDTLIFIVVLGDFKVGHTCKYYVLLQCTCKIFILSQWSPGPTVVYIDLVTQLIFNFGLCEWSVRTCFIISPFDTILSVDMRLCCPNSIKIGL